MFNFFSTSQINDGHVAAPYIYENQSFFRMERLHTKSDMLLDFGMSKVGPTETITFIFIGEGIDSICKSLR